MKNIYNRFGVSKKTFPTLLATLFIISSFFFTSGFASRVSADEIISPVEQTLTQEKVVSTDVAVTEEVFVVSEEPSAPIIVEAVPVVEQVVAPSEEPASAPAEEQVLPVPAPVVVNSPTLSTDKEDYQPGETVSIFGKFFSAFQNIVVRIFGNSEVGNHYSDVSIPVTTNQDGLFSLSYQLDNFYRPIYSLIASAIDGTELVSTTFLDGPGASANLDQGKNGGSGDPVIDPVQWVNGNVNANQGHYIEGQSIPYRMVVTGLTPGVQATLVIGFDVKQSSKFAVDYITTNKRINEDVDPCVGVAPCNQGADYLLPAPAYTGTAGGAGTPANVLASFSALPVNERQMKVWNGVIDSVLYTTQANLSLASSEAQVTVKFTPNNSTAVLSWGGHISSSADYPGLSAVTLTGSPYHTRLIEINGAGGNQDRALAAGAIIPPSTITIIKDTSPNNAQDFNFSATGVLSPTAFTLDDDGDNTNGVSNSQTFSVAPGNYSFSENDPSGLGYTLSGLSCGTVTGTGTTATSNQGNRTVSVTIGAAGGANVVCTFTNSLSQATLTLVKQVNNDNGGTANATAWTLSATGPTNISGTTGTVAVTNASVNAGVYTLAETGGPSGYIASNWSCTAGTLNGAQLTLAPGQNATCTITNDDQPATLIVKKSVNNGNTGATKTASDFSFSVNGGTAVAFESDGQNDNTVNAGVYTVTEPAVTGYTTTYDNCSNVVIPNGGTATCTITNTAIAPTLTLVKTVVNDNGGTASASNFQGKIDGNNVVWSAAISVSAGAHTASEVTLPTYTASVWGGDCAADGSVTLALGENKTCTITNDDIAPKLHLRKVVVNNNGGTKTFADFTLTADGTGANDISGTSPVDSTAELKADTFALSETNVLGYTASAWSCVGGTQSGSNITLGLGEEATCTITNDDQPAQIKIIKNTVGGNGTFDFTVTGPVQSSPSISTTNGTGTTGFVEVSAGNYSITEGAVAGWDLTSATCDTGTPASISLANGQSVTCTFENTKRGHLIVEKTTLPAGDTTSFSITASGTGTIVGGGAGSITDATDKDYEVTPGTYSVSETVPAGWDKTGDTCQNVVVGAGETKTCTITNTKRATIVIVKDAINNDAQDFTFNNNFANGNPSTFALDDDANGTLPNTRSFEVLPGTYAVSEDAVAGWQQESATCSNQSPVGAIAVAPGETVTCTFVNEELAKIVLVKNTVGGDGTFDFTMTGAGLAGNTQLVTTGNTATETFENLDQDNTYSIAETVPEGWDLTSSSCTGTGNTPASITPNPGETVTCTFTNTKRPKLTVTKVVINDNGGTKDVIDFPLFVDQTSVVSGATNIFTTGAHTVSETNQTGYTGVISGDCAADGSVTLVAGDDKHCRITNNDNAPSLTLVKQVTNDNGGTAVAANWTLTADGPTDISGAGGTTSDATFGAGTYTLSESVGPAGYVAGQWSCTGTGTQNGVEITLGLGQSATCTIINNDVAPKLTVIKHVINNNGGTAVAGDFTMNVTATNPSDASFAGDEAGIVITLDAGAYSVDESAFVGYAKTLGENCSGTIAVGEEKTCTITNDDIAPKLTLVKTVVNDNGGNAVVSDFLLTINGNPAVSGVSQTLSANTLYTAAETNLPGYAASAWGGDCAANGTITLAPGDNKTCTITNDDIAPKLTIVKTVVNDNGGTAQVSDFPLFVNGSGVTSGVANALNANTLYTATETNKTGYTASVWGGDCAADGTITLNEGDNKTCTITNDDQTAHLKIVKTVTNDNGGSANPTDFTLSANGPTSISGAGGAESDVNAGAYILSETSLPGYTAGSWSCVGGTQNGSSITLGLGQSATCTINNDDQQAYIIVDKTVVNDNGGGAVANDFKLTVDGNVVSDAVAYPVNPGTHTAGETNLPGYTAGEWGGDCAANGSVTVALGETKTCTITNNDIAPKLTVIKHVINDSGDIAQAGDFTMLVTGINVSQPSFPGSETGVTVTLNAGTYSVDEANNNGYIKTLGANCSGTIAVGEEKTCVITNNDIPHATRTQGFWQTHTNYTMSVFNDIGTLTIGTKVIDTHSELFSGFYASISKTTANKKRTALDQARMQMLQQWLAAQLNCEAFGCSITTQTLLTNAATAWAGTDRNLILSYASQLDVYNNSNDALPIAGQGKATPKDSQSLAGTSLSVWNMLP